MLDGNYVQNDSKGKLHSIKSLDSVPSKTFHLGRSTKSRSKLLKRVTVAVTAWPVFVGLPACKALSDSALFLEIIDVPARFALFQSRATT
ncbi:unnamed protein product [Fusarium venenatum]|uniref:Uncharacterized protein n=1 Tax=Fusarium venenatum TaxID=56646 RepID=A0A2L2T171_9HYPO|nr:uncharacterized protein FVRRES_11500 [Fusarium venenatum]CEI38809.1 unnamed protein product [Fusarium venenatum]